MNPILILSISLLIYGLAVAGIIHGIRWLVSNKDNSKEIISKEDNQLISAKNWSVTTIHFKNKETNQIGFTTYTHNIKVFNRAKILNINGSEEYYSEPVYKKTPRSYLDNKIIMRQVIDITYLRHTDVVNTNFKTIQGFWEGNKHLIPIPAIQYQNAKRWKLEKKQD